jgi:hypothetical protein
MYVPLPDPDGEPEPKSFFKTGSAAATSLDVGFPASL